MGTRPSPGRGPLKPGQQRRKPVNPRSGRAPGGKRKGGGPRRGLAGLLVRYHKLISLALVVVMVPVSVSYYYALTAPGTLSVPIRTVEWVRSMGGGPVVRLAERVWYSMNQPAKGGKPSAGVLNGFASHRGGAGKGTSSSGAAPGSSGTASTATTAPVVPHLPAPPPITPIVTPALAGEGAWSPAGQAVHGIPAIYTTFVRPSRTYSSLVAGVAWMDTKLLVPKLFAGYKEPGGSGWRYQSPVPASMRSGLVATFNSGFRLSAAQGGFYAYGKYGRNQPLVNGAASFVIYSNGSVNIGSWGSQVNMSPGVAAVRQNLALVVNNGAPVPGLRHQNYQRWGATLGNKVLVWRSGLGITANGALVYVGGRDLSVYTLARLLARAGAVRGMELDINTDWVNFFSFNPPPGQPAAPANGTKLVANMIRPRARYFGPTARDFIAMFAR